MVQQVWREETYRHVHTTLETVFKVDAKVIPPASPEGGDRWIVLETVFKVDKREGDHKLFVRQKWSPPPSREQEGGRQKTILKQLAARGRGRGRGGPYLSDESGPPREPERARGREAKFRVSVNQLLLLLVL